MSFLAKRILSIAFVTILLWETFFWLTLIGIAWNDTAPMAVMVFIHGESYETGTGNAYDGSVLSSYGGVIVVTLNYRLGVLGFLSMEDQSAMGNYALVDITQALLWLKKNIIKFNGDPQRVTVFGHGTGASLVNILMLTSPFKRKKDELFQRAILQSGSAGSTWSVSYDPKWCAEQLARNVNCSRYLSNSEALVNCLRGKSFTELVNAAPKAPKYYSCFAPTVNKLWTFPAHVDALVTERKSVFASMPVMFGITKNEAYSYLKQTEINEGFSNARKSQIIRTYVQNVFKYHRQKIYEILDHHYTDWTHPYGNISNRNNILELLSDGQYVAPLIEMANEHSMTADTYLYSFPYSTQMGLTEDVTGIHGDELPYVFGSPLVNGSSPFPSSGPYTNTEKMLSEVVMTYWSNFAKTGNPNFPRKQTMPHNGKVDNPFKHLKWPKYTKDSQEYLPLSRHPTIQHHYRAQKLALWHDLIPKIDRDDGKSDRSSHLLDNWDDESSFDDFGRLVPNYDDSLFPSPPPMPPTRPTPIKFSSDQTRTTQPDGNGLTLGPDGDNGNGRPGDGSNNGSSGGGTGPGGITSESVKTAGSDSGTSGAGIPLSIVVAVGGSFLLINLLIFAGFCYQRERIRKMRIGKPDERPALHHFEDADNKFDRKRLDGQSGHVQQHNLLHSERNSFGASSPAPTAAECMSLMSSAGSTAVNHSNSYGTPKNGITHIHNPSPQPSNQSRSRGSSQPRTTPPIDNLSCSYSAVPTEVTSPIHRAGRGGSGSGCSNDGSPSVVVIGDISGGEGGDGTPHLVSDDSGRHISGDTGCGASGLDISGGDSAMANYVNSKPRLDNNIMGIGYVGHGHTTNPPPPAYNSVGNAVSGGGGGGSGVGNASAFVPATNKHKASVGFTRPLQNSTSSFGDIGGGGVGSSSVGSGGGGAGGLTTFGPGYSGMGRSREGPALSSPGSNGNGNGVSGGGGGGGGGGGDGNVVYKTINKSGNPTNAVTIV